MYGGGFNKCVQLPQILSQTSTSAQIYITWATDSAGYYGSVTWLAIGKQQWGSSNVTHRDTTVTFPIAFSVLYSVVGVPKSSSNLSGSNSNFGVKSQNNTSFIANMYDNGNGYAGFNWCAFGKA